MADWIQAGALVVMAALYAVRSVAQLRLLMKIAAVAETAGEKLERLTGRSRPGR